MKLKYLILNCSNSGFFCLLIFCILCVRLCILQCWRMVNQWILYLPWCDTFISSYYMSDEMQDSKCLARSSFKSASLSRQNFWIIPILHERLFAFYGRFCLITNESLDVRKSIRKGKQLPTSDSLMTNLQISFLVMLQDDKGERYLASHL